MQTLAFFFVAIAMGVNTAALAASNSVQSSKLRYSEEYIRYRCELNKLSGDSFENLLSADGNLTDEAKEALMKRLDAEDHLKEQFKSAISTPYPPELQGYKPKSFELVEFLWRPIPCSEGRYQDGLALPATFRCRLDKLILRDGETGKQFSTIAALVDFDSLYEDGDERKLESSPRPLPSEPYKTVGVITLKGTVDGKVSTVSRAWLDGSPAEIVTSTEWGAEEEEPEFTPTADLPIVTGANASIFIFDLKNEAPYIRDGHGDPLKQYSFEVHGCRS